jgi:hypothetical protein
VLVSLARTHSYPGEGINDPCDSQNATISEEVAVAKIDSHALSSALAYHHYFHASLISSISYYRSMMFFALVYHHMFQNLLNHNVFHTNILSSFDLCLTVHLQCRQCNKIKIN